MKIKHASIVPLIGGETIGSEQAFGSPPEYFMSYTPFMSNDQHILNHYDNKIPYYLLDKGEFPDHSVDVVGSVCPCAGLSMLSHGYGDDNPNNRWLTETAEYVLGTLKPKVFWGENAPGFAGKIGKTVRDQMYKIGRDNNYSMTVYRTKSLLHGVPQVRERSFYFFWKDMKTPELKYYNTPYMSIEDTILSVKDSNSMTEVINKKKPTEDPYYRFILEEIHGGITHAEFSQIIEPANARGNDTFGYIEKMGYTYDKVGEWMASNGFEKELEKCKYKFDKLKSGKSIMRRGTIVPKDRIGAFVGHYPTMLTHPVEDRYINYREAMTIMGLPEDFMLIDPKKNFNHICQNVPVQTARDMATEIREVLAGNRNILNSDLTFQFNASRKTEVEENISDLTNFFHEDA